MKIYDKVLKSLKENPITRSSDKELIWYLCGGHNGIMTKEMFMKAIPFETITRARRKVQEHHPELCATDRVNKLRKQKQQEFPKFLF